MNKSSSRVVLITGTSSGIGACCAAYLAERGYRVYGASRSATAPPGVVPLSIDVTDDASVSQAVATVLDREGRVDVLINSAGFGIAGAVEDTTMEEAAAQFDVNFFGTVRVCHAVLPVMRSQNAGYIVNIGSIGGVIAIPFQGFYSASKFALEGLSESLRIEVRPFGIHVVVIEPGDHRTGFTQNRRPTAASTGPSAYHNRFERAIARMASDEQNGPKPDAIAHLVQKVIDDPHPRLRYTIGPASQRAAVWLKRLLPNRIVEGIITRYYENQRSG
jgi:NAD(P)-dependent dehydrogenase (short-subunit alcohol dehydrogenase family)